MTRAVSLVLTVFFVAIFQSCTPSPQEGIKYNDKIIEQVNRVVNADNALTEALSKEPADMKAAQEALVKQIDASMDAIKKSGRFDGKTEFMDVALKYLTVYKGVAEKEYKEMVTINSKPGEEFTEEDDNKYKQMNEVSSKKLKDASDEFNSFQQAFASKYKFEIENKSSKQ